MRLTYLFLLLTLLATYWATWRRVVRQSSGLSPLLGWILGLGFFVVTPLTIMVLNGGFALPAVYGVDRPWASVDFSSTRYFLPYVVIWLSLMLCCFVMYVFSTRENSEPRETPRSIKPVQRALWVAFAVAVCYWIFNIEVAGGITEFLISHWYARSEDLSVRYGDAYVLLSHLALCNQVIFTGAAALYTGLALRDRSFSRKIVFIIAFELSGETLISGNRIHIAIYFLAAFTSCWLYKRTRVIITMCAVAPMLVVIFSMWASVRGNLSDLPDTTGAYFASERGNNVVTSLMDVTEGTDTMILIHIIRDFGNDVPYLYGQSYLRAITSLIPRRLYPGKSENFTTMLADVYLPGEVTSLNATALGEMYANCGPFSIFLMPLVTFGIIWLSDWSVRAQARCPLRPAILFVLAIGAARVTLEDSVVLFVLATAALRLVAIEPTAGNVFFSEPNLQRG